MGLLRDESDNQSKEWARRLASVTRSKLNVLGVWAREFFALKKEHPPELVEEVLTWYCKHFGEPYVPECHSGASFRAKFTQLLAARDRELPEPEEQDKALAWAFIDRMHPPGSLVLHIPGLVRLTRENWQKFLNAVRKKATPNTCTTRDLAFLQRVIAYHAPLFVENWLVYALVERRDVSGPIKNLAFFPTNPRFRVLWQKWSFDWSGLPATFDHLLEELGNECK